jgi:putative ABC transport system ATP-binding protein
LGLDRIAGCARVGVLSCGYVTEVALMALRTVAGTSLEVRGLRAAYAERGRAPRNVLDVRRFRIDGGAQVAICGPSGSGKTTLLHLLAGLERPRRGEIRWGEVDITTFPERGADRWRRETVGLVFQQFHLFPGLSALENVLLPLRFDRWVIEPVLRTRASKLLERVGVRPAGDVADLSRGEQQKVAVARALLRKPAIVLADEPTASLDRDAANVVADLLSSLCRGANATLVVATHDPSVAGRLDGAYDVVDGDLRAREPVAVRPPLRSAA